MKVLIAMALEPRRVEQRWLELPEGACLGDALAAGGIDVQALGVSMSQGVSQSETASATATPSVTVGVWGRTRPLQWPLVDGDRIELCRALEVQPMEARRRRHEHQQRWKAARKATVR
jgi:uncharacterized protein